MKSLHEDILTKLNVLSINEAVLEGDGQKKNKGREFLLNAAAASARGQNPQSWLWLWRGNVEFPEEKYFAELIDLHFPKRSKPDLRILHGSIEIANQMNVLTAGLRTIGVSSDSLNYYPYYLNYQNDYTWDLRNQRSTPELNRKLRKLTEEFTAIYDLFHFHFGTTLTFDYSDFSMLKDAGKSMVMHHWGSDVRLHSEALKSNPYALVKDKNEIGIHQKLKTLSSQINHCIIPDYELFPYVKDYYEHVHIIPSAIDLQSYQPVSIRKQNEPPLIVHAPTSPFIKGTAFILKAVEKLKDKYTFQFQLVQGMSHQEAKKIYERADVIIDQLHIGSYGLFSVESMALGKPVVCYISDEMQQHYPKDLPVISANPDTIEAVIASLLQNIDSFPETGRKSRLYAEKYHDSAAVCPLIHHVYQDVINNPC
ncbi:glycosyltransferase family 1 protein [Metabacillus sp. SLBN-84]